MTNQHYHMNLSIASPSEIEHTAQLSIRAREEFLMKGGLAVHPPRPIILESWQRCHALHVNPTQCSAPLATSSEAQLYDVREANEPLIRAARPVMERLTDFLADSGYVVVLSDASGCLLEVAGDVNIRRHLAHIDSHTRKQLE